ncbi:hypothetical protein AC578_4480 [Pseudocercospora eumusae]|uniref:Rhodopsin domain-containing protein n=1 Tax=Pseudocercospora eumusae TaxID=321146 RepID=A0A139HBT2_9PEZI|nr:hypothetical protein AC578_4480 [Pseudocercospora eumusae]
MVSGHAVQPAIYAVTFTSTLLAILAVALRLYTRIRIVRNPDWDDLLSALALGFTCVFTVCVALETYYGLGRHLNTLTKDERINSLLWLWISVIFYHIGLGLAKLAILAQCLRVFGSIRRFQIAAWIVASIIVSYSIWAIVSLIFLCKPITYFWHPDAEGKCLPKLPIWFLNSALGIFTDILVAILPLPVVKSLRLPRRQKNMLMLVFALGGSVCIITIIRLYSLYAVTISNDDSYDNPQAAIYSTIEIAATIIFGCLPAYNAFVAQHFPDFWNGYACASRGSGGIAQPSFRVNESSGDDVDVDATRSSSTNEIIPRVLRRETR